MPQKKNFDAAELLRGKSGRLHGNLTSLLTMVKGLPLTYNRDMQEDKLPVFDSHDQTVLCAEVVKAALAGARFREDRCAAAVADPLLLATDVADYLVARGVPFREAHHAVGLLVKEAETAGVPLPQLPLEKVQGVHKAFAADWTQCFDLDRAMRMRERPGMPGPRQVVREIARWRKVFANHTG
jgi:argininosuccinate lyase